MQFRIYPVLRRLNINISMKLAQTRAYCPIFEDLKSPAYLQQQSKIIPGPERIRVSAINFDQPLESFNSRTVYELVQDISKNNDVSRNMLGYIKPDCKSVIYMSYEEVWKEATELGSALAQFGVKAKDIVTINWKNSPIFFIYMLANCSYRYVSAPIYPLLGEDEIINILKLCESKVHFAENIVKMDYIIEKKEQLPELKVVISEVTNDPVIKAKAQEKNLEIISYSDFLRLGSKCLKPHEPPAAKDIFTLVFTSGTTGMPKAAIMTHSSFAHCMSFCRTVFGNWMARKGEQTLSFLPPAHIYELTFQFCSIVNGSAVVFFRGENSLLMEDFSLVKPFCVPLVPRVMNKIYHVIWQELKKSKFKRALFEFAYDRKKKLFMQDIVTHETIWDKIVFRKIQQLFGGNCRIILSTSAPLSKEVLEFFRLVIGCWVVEIYGSTETIFATYTSPADNLINDVNIGAPLNFVEIKLTDVPERGFYAKDDVGEICVRTPMGFSGYYKDEVATSETIKDGWIYMGDIGRWNSNGTLSIFDRKKNIFKLAQGEYMSPEQIEAAYLTIPEIANIFVDGISTEEFCIAIVVPDHDLFAKWAAKRGFVSPSFDDLCQNREVRFEFIKYMQQMGSQNKLNTLEQVQNIFLGSQPFTVENGLMTTTMKLKRDPLRKNYEKVILDMYKEGSLAKPSSNEK